MQLQSLKRKIEQKEIIIEQLVYYKIFQKFLRNFLTKLSEKWKQSLYNGLVFGVSLTDFWKSFDCLLHELLAAKLIEYGVESSSWIIQRIQGRVLTVWVELVIYIARVLLFLHKSGLVFIKVTWSNEVKKKDKI